MVNSISIHNDMAVAVGPGSWTPLQCLLALYGLPESSQDHQDELISTIQLTLLAM